MVEGVHKVVPPILIKLLNSLEYPFSNLFNLESQAELVRLASWLEDRKIRALEIAERDNLRLNNDKWQSVFQNYLCQLSCPFKWSYPSLLQSQSVSSEYHSNDDDESSAANIDCILWLVSYAINMEYEDIADEVVDIEKTHNNHKSMMIIESSNGIINTPNTDELLVETNNDSNTDDSANSSNSSLASADINSFGELLKMPRKLNENDSDYFERLGYRVHLYYSSIAKAALDTSNNTPNQDSNNSNMDVDTSSSTTAAATSSVINWSQFPLGFDTKDPQLNQLAIVLKMLHLDDFRDLQSDLNALIALGQEYTANPRTNTSLGRVGR